ncbi:MAG: ferritin-like domain-containing protein [Pseudomonadota bacterium]
MVKKAEKNKKEIVIGVLNSARAMELQAIHQYMNQHYRLDDMDYGELAAQVKLIAIDEMRHAEAFAERIKELGGEPTVDKAEPVEKGQDVDVIFSFDAGEEDKAIIAYNGFLNICRDSGDSVTAKLFEMVIDEEQAHYNYFDAVAGHISRLGAVYLAKIAGTSSATGLNTQGFVARQGGGGA